jgi:hypothetical protein
MFLTDDGGHCVRKVTLDGKVLIELGVPGKPAPYMRGEPSFHRCTHTALSPKGEIYVSDGCGNSRVHKYSPDGKLRVSPAPSSASSSHRTVSPPTGMATFMSAKSRGPPGHRSIRASRTPPICTRCRNSKRSSKFFAHGRDRLCT